MNQPIPQDPQERIAELEAQLKRVSFERDMYRQSTNSLVREYVPFVPPTEAEFEEMVNGPRGESILSVIEELEREHGIAS